MKHSIVLYGCVMVCVWRAIKYFVCVFDVFQGGFSVMFVCTGVFVCLVVFVCIVVFEGQYAVCRACRGPYDLPTKV